MQTTPPISLPVVIIAGLGGLSAFLANMISFTMIGKINERVPENERISLIWWGTEVRTRFKQLYPGNRLVLLHDYCVVVMILCFILGARFWVFG